MGIRHVFLCGVFVDLTKLSEGIRLKQEIIEVPQSGVFKQSKRW
jgi:hypothetical protein